MQKLHANFFKLACALLLLLTSWQMRAQTTSPSYCPTLTGMPDTFYACKNTRPQLPYPLIGNIGVSGTVLLDTQWTPRANLTHPDSLITDAYVALSSTNYTITVRSIRPNIAANSTFDQTSPLGFYTDYLPKTGTFPMQPGFFMITDDPAKANATFATIPDHGTVSGTGGNGNMLVVNGATQPNKVVWGQTINMIPGETYELLAWATPVHQVNTPTLQWRVNGVLQTSPNSPLSLPPIVGPNLWLPMRVNYTKPANSLNVTDNIEIINLETSPDPGNDFALDDITIRPLCIQRDSVYVKTINLRPLLDIAAIRYGCGQDTVDFNGDTTAIGTAIVPPATVPDRYFWDFGDGQTSTQKSPRHIYSTNSQDSFIVKLYVYKDAINPNGTITCVDSAIPKIYRKRPGFHAGFTQDKDSVCKGNIVNFKDTSKPANTLPWIYYFGGFDQPGYFDSSNQTRDVAYKFDTAGRFLVLQVVTDQYGCTDTARDTVVSIGPVSLSFSLTDTVLCEGQQLRAKTLIDSSYRQYLWNFGDGRIVKDSTSITQTYLMPGNYNIGFSATHNICPNVSTTRPVTILATPRVQLGRDTFICPTGQPILLQNLITNNASTTKYKWNTGDETPQILVRHEGTYFLTATNLKGCSAADTIVITRNCFLDIPTAFTPDGDGESDFFLPRQIFSKGLTAFRMKIYNRWGQQIFETERTDGRGWDGKFNGNDQPTGVYLYFIEATLQNGMTEKYEGNVTLLR